MRSKKASWLRRPRTTNERRASPKRSVICDEGFVVKIRANRNFTNIPNAWDDITTSSERSWKSHRKTQYKPL